jgi:hypothetical protein
MRIISETELTDVMSAALTAVTARVYNAYAFSMAQPVRMRLTGA